MKRIIAFALILVLALSLVACGGEPDPSKLILGTWKTSNYSCTFNADGTGNVVVDMGTAVSCKWSYNADTGLYDVDWGYGKDTATLKTQDDGTTVLIWKGSTYKRA